MMGAVLCAILFVTSFYCGSFYSIVSPFCSNRNGWPSKRFIKRAILNDAKSVSLSRTPRALALAPFPLDHFCFLLLSGEKKGKVRKKGSALHSALIALSLRLFRHCVRSVVGRDNHHAFPSYRTSVA